MMNYLIKLSESDKRVLIAILLIFILLLVLIGYLVKLIKYIVKVQSNFVDKSMYDILDANLITEKKKFFQISWEKNRRKFYFDARIPMLTVIFLIAFILIYQTVINDYSWKFIANYAKEASFTLSWPTTKIFGIPVISDWPKIAKASVFHFNEFGAWVTYIFLLVAAYCVIHFIICTCALMARDYRTIIVGNDYFKKDLHDLKQAKMKAGQIHTKKPTQEMKDFAEGKETTKEE